MRTQKGLSMNIKTLCPWIFTTYNCNCKCPYCVAKKTENASMSPENFEKMLWTTEKIFEKGDYENAIFTLSGGEPFLVWKNYSDIVSKYRLKYKERMGFCLLSNLTILTDDMLEWLLKNNIGVQVSLDDLEKSKPLKTGKKSVEIVLQNIERLKEAKIKFSINTVFDYNSTKSLLPLADYICYTNPHQWGLSAPFDLEDESILNELLNQFKLTISRLKTIGFDIYNKLRFYNEILSCPGFSYIMKKKYFTVGINLEVWRSHSLINKNILGYFDENIKELLISYQRSTKSLPSKCVDCSVVHWCRGRSVLSQGSKKSEVLTCKIKQEIIEFMLITTRNYHPFHNDFTYSECIGCNCTLYSANDFK
jgi:sulfatase maturation enzyme AslB (radical SAM superfamily)